MTKKVPVVLFCGGKKILIDENKPRALKALVPISSKSILSRNIGHYAYYGFTDFILCATSEMKDLRFCIEHDFRDVRWRTENSAQVNLFGSLLSINIVNTGNDAQTGERLLAAKPYLEGCETFSVHYSDTLSSVALNEVLKFHLDHKKIATLLGARMPIRFRILGTRVGENQVRGFSSRPVIPNDFINGGYYFFEYSIFNLKSFKTEKPILEGAILEELASKNQLMMFPWENEWQFLDSERDLPRLEEIISNVPWE